MQEVAQEDTLHVGHNQVEFQPQYQEDHDVLYFQKNQKNTSGIHYCHTNEDEDLLDIIPQEARLKSDHGMNHIQ